MAQREFVTISTHLYPHDASLAILKARLDDEGIPFFMQDDHYVSIAPFESLAIGGVKLRIPSKFEQRVGELIHQMQNQPPIQEEEVDPEEAAWLAERLHQQRAYTKRVNKWAPIVGVLIVIISILGFLMKEVFTTAGPRTPNSYSSQPVP